MNYFRFLLFIFCLTSIGVWGQESEASPKLDLVEYRNVPLREALQALSLQSNMNIAASKQASEINISLFLRDVSIDDVLRTLCDTHNLILKREKKTDIVQIHTRESFQEKIDPIKGEQEEVFTLMYPNVIDVAVAIRDLFGSKVRLSFGADDQEISDELNERFERFDTIDSRSQTLGFFDSSSGAASSESQSEDNADESEDSEDSSESSSVSFGPSDQEATVFITLIKRHNLMAVRTEDVNMMERIRRLIRRLDVPTPLVLLEVKILAIDLGDDFNSVFEFQYSDEAHVAGGFSLGDILAPASDNAVDRRTQSLAPGGTGINSGDMLFQFVNNDFRARIQLLESQDRVTTLATPFLLTANNEVSRLFEGREIPLNRSFQGGQNIVAGSTTTTTPGSTEIEFRPVGTTLLITPNINADRTVTLRILQESSQIIADGASLLVPTNSNFITENIDIVSAQSVSGTIVAKDGFAVAIGGLIEENLRDDEAKVPFLGDWPLIGPLFTRKTTAKSRTERVVMVRPYVLSTPAESAALSKTLMEELSLHPVAKGEGKTMNLFDREDVLKEDKHQRLREKFHFHTLDEEVD